MMVERSVIKNKHIYSGHCTKTDKKRAYILPAVNIMDIYEQIDYNI